jgi:hypothetical protein
MIIAGSALPAYVTIASVSQNGSRRMKIAGAIGMPTIVNGRRAFTFGSVELASSG